MSNDIGRVWESFPDIKEAIEAFALYHSRDAHRVELAQQAGQADYDLFVQAVMTSPDEINPVLGRKVEALEWMNFRQIGTNPKSPFAKSPTPKFELDQAVQDVAARGGHDDPAAIRLTGVYHNLLRRGADA